MKKYMVYMDDGRDCFKAAIPAPNEKAARKYVDEIWKQAWGYIDYEKPLSEKDASDYELTQGGAYH
jgi:hypothetical protein